MVAAPTRHATYAERLSAMWDPYQREILVALGCTPWMMAPTEIPDDPLLRALLHAAGCAPDAADVAAVLRMLPPTSSLLGNPGAKRALWPRLRQLRRTSQ